MSDDTKSADAIEAEIEATRARLASTVDQLAARAAPKEIARRQVESAKVTLKDAAYTPDGQLRTERVAAVGGVVALLIGLVVFRRIRS